MFDVSRTAAFDSWLRGLGDATARAAIEMRIDRLRQGNPGDTKMIGNAVREMRVNHGPGYRVFYCQVDSAIYLLLCGGDKSTQKRDIKKAFEMAALLKAVDD